MLISYPWIVKLTCFSSIGNPDIPLKVPATASYEVVVERLNCV